MKYTNKWIVVPYNFISNFDSQQNISKKIFANKSMSNDEKIEAYNYHVLKNHRKLNANANMDNNLNELKTESEIDLKSDASYNDELNKTQYDDIFRSVLKPKLFDNLELSYKNENISNTPVKPDWLENLDKKNKNSKMTEDEDRNEPPQAAEDSFMNLSMFEKPPYQNTRSQREIDQNLYIKVLKKSKEKNKKKNKESKEDNREINSPVNDTILQDSVTWDSQFDIGYNKKK